MNTAGIRPEDLVLCDVNGRRFHAYVQERVERRFVVRPIERGINYHRVTAQQILKHWRLSKQSLGRGVTT